MSSRLRLRLLFPIATFALLAPFGLPGEADAASFPAGRFFALSPCRLLDTRPIASPVQSGVPRFVQVTGACGVPSSAKAVSINVTVVSPSAGGHLQVFPSDRGTSITFMNFDAGETLGNHGIAQLSTSGAGALALNAYLVDGGTVHVVIDVLGYFSSNTTVTPNGPLGFVAMPSCRLLDTRSSGILSGGQVVSLAVQGQCGVPTGARAAALNVAAVSTQT